MPNIVLYLDGAGGKIAGQKEIYPIGWGVIALHDNKTVERRGTYEVPCAHKDDFEFIAFFEAVRYARTQGFLPSEMSIYVDDESLAYAGFRMHPENYFSKVTVDLFVQRLARIAKTLYTSQDLLDVLACLQQARMTKLKGHQFCVYQNRVDYFARKGVRELLTGRRTAVTPFERWLKAGFAFCTTPAGHQQQWYPPFSRPAIGLQ